MHGGGVFIGIRNDIIATEQVRLDVHNCEIITVYKIRKIQDSSPLQLLLPTSFWY